MIRAYELTYLISPDFSEEELKSFCDKIGSFISEAAGIVENQSNPMKRKLAYPIKKRVEAFLETITFKIASENLEKIENKLKTEKDILRYIIIIKKPVKKVKERMIFKPREIISAREKKIIRPEKEESQKIELKEIDKKIEEILSQ